MPGSGSKDIVFWYDFSDGIPFLHLKQNPWLMYTNEICAGTMGISEAYCAKVVYCWSGHLTTTQVVVSWPLQKHWSKAIYTILGSTYHPQISLLPRFFTILCLVQSALTGTSSVPIRISDGNSHPTRELFSDRWLNKARPRYSTKVTPRFPWCADTTCW